MRGVGGEGSATNLDQDEFVEQNTLAHVGQRDARHNDESADQEASTPCFQDECIRVRGLGHHFSLRQEDESVDQRMRSHWRWHTTHTSCGKRWGEGEHQVFTEASSLEGEGGCEGLRNGESQASPYRSDH